MNAIIKKTRRFLADDRGLELVEYTLVAGLIVLIGVAALSGLVRKMENVFNILLSALS